MSASPEMRLVVAPEPLLERPTSTTTTIPEWDQQLRRTSSPLAERQLGVEDGESCHTPKSEEYKIPVMETCPPAPKKARLGVLPCRRKLQMDFKLIHVRHEETKTFFQMLSNSRKRNRCFLGEDD